MERADAHELLAALLQRDELRDHIDDVSRLRNLLKTEHVSTQKAFDEYAATVNAHSWARWPASRNAPPRKFEPSGKSRLPTLASPSLVGLRLRGLFGTGARAELILALISEPGADRSAAELARRVSYTKRNVNDILEGLRAAGLVRLKASGNQARYRLAHRRQLSEWLGELPDNFPRWNPIFRLMLAFGRLSRKIHHKSSKARAAEASRMLREHGALLMELDLLEPPPQETAEKYSDAFSAWATRLAADIASGSR